MEGFCRRGRKPKLITAWWWSSGGTDGGSSSIWQIFFSWSLMASIRDLFRSINLLCWSIKAFFIPYFKCVTRWTSSMKSQGNCIKFWEALWDSRYWELRWIIFFEWMTYLSSVRQWLRQVFWLCWDSKRRMLCVPGNDLLWRLRQGANTICSLSPNDQGYKYRFAPPPRLVNSSNSTVYHADQSRRRRRQDAWPEPKETNFSMAYIAIHLRSCFEYIG